MTTRKMALSQTGDVRVEGHIATKNVTPTLHQNESKSGAKIQRYQSNEQRTKGPPHLKNHLPPKTMKISKVGVVKRRRERNQAKTNEQETSIISLPSLRECIESRPPLDTDLSGPTIYSYDTPRDKPEMSSYPSYTIRPNTQRNRDGGDRTAWGKEWFSHNYVWLYKADFDPRIKWPSPAHYNIPTAVGTSNAPYSQAPSHTFGKRQAFALTRKGLEDEPSPNTYNSGKCKDQTMNKDVSFTIPQGRRRGTVLWAKRESVPGPGSYEAAVESKSIKPRSAAFSFATSPRRFDFQTRYSL